MASTGHSGTQASQSMQLAGSMYSIFSPSWKQSIGQTATQSVYLQPTQGSVTTKATLMSSFEMGRAVAGRHGRHLAPLLMPPEARKRTRRYNENEPTDAWCAPTTPKASP